MCQRLGTIIVFLALATQAAVAESAFRIERPTPFEHLTTRDGLSQMSVLVILQDRQGFMWFGTADGLNRYDGATFKIFKHRPGDPDSLLPGPIRALHRDATGKLWMAVGRGLSQFDPVTEKFTHYRHDPDDPQSLAGHGVSAITEGSAGGLWVGSPGGGLSRFDPVTRSFTHYRHEPGHPDSSSHDEVSALWRDSSGSLWIATHGGLDKFDPETESLIRYRHDGEDPRSLSHDRVMALLTDSSGGLWVGTDGGGLNRFDPVTESFARHRHEDDDPASLSGDRVLSILEDAAGHLWIGTRDSGLSRFDPARQSFTRYRHDPASPTSLARGAVHSIFEDLTGGLWIGTSDGGLNRFDPARGGFFHFRHRAGDPNSLSHDYVRAVFEDRSGELWIGTRDGGLNRFDPAHERWTHYRQDDDDPESLSSDRVRTIMEDAAGKLWIGTLTGGLNLFDPVHGKFLQFAADPPLLDIRALLEDRSGELWIGMFNGGLARLDRDREHLGRYRHDAEDPHSLSHDYVYCLLEDRSGRLWIGTAGGGLNRSDPASERFIHYRHDPADTDSLSSDTVNSIFEDSSGRLWIATPSGLNGFDPGQGIFTHFTESEGLGHDFIYGILEDDLKRLWLSTNHGLARFDPATNRWASYDTRDGLQDNEFNTGAFHRSARGMMYFGGIHGFNAFKPEQFRDNSYLPPIVATSFKIFGQEVDLGRSSSYLEEIELGYQDNYFSFEFAALSFTRPDNNQYAYMLEGFDDSWIESGTRRYANYTNVPAGDYTFRIRGSNNDGVWNQEGTSIAIAVRPPPWKTWWAYTLYSLALVSMITLYVRSQKKELEHERAIAEQERTTSQRLSEADAVKSELIEALEAKNAELANYHQILAHDLKNPLVTIGLFLGALRRDEAAGDTRRLAQDFGRITLAVTQMRQLLEKLPEYSRAGERATSPQTVGLKELAHEAMDLVSDEIAERGIEVHVAPDLPIVYGDRERLLVVFTTLFDNAVKFMGDEPRPRIEVGARQCEEDVTFHVRDNGIGIDPRYYKKIFGLFDRLDPAGGGTGMGLALAKKIVEAHGGSIWVESEGLGSGSTLCVTLPRRGASSKGDGELSGLVV